MKNWEKKLLSFVLTLVMTAVIIPTLFATPAYAVASTSWTKLGGSTGGQTIGASGKTYYYYIDANTTCSNTNNGGSGLTIAGGATVYIYIPANVTLTCTGAAGSGVTGGGAGIWVPSNSTLYIIGNGTISATGGAAAAGSGGGAGQKASTPFVRSGYSTDGTHNALLINSGSGGNGGNGGGGAGAGIGTPGGAGGAGGVGGRGFGANGNPTAEMLLHVAYTGGGWNPNGGAWGSAGSAGTKGTAGAAMGTLGIQTTITQSIKGGAASGTAGKYTNNSLGYDTDVVLNANKQYRWISMPGGGGGGGGSGYAAANIGAGGGGGGGGGGGRAGGVSYTNAQYAPFYASYVGGGGTGNATGTGSTTTTQYYNTGFSPDKWDGTNGWAKGGAGAGAGTAKAAGTATLGAIVTYNPQNGAATWANSNVTIGLDMPAVTKPTYNGFTFAGWYDDPVGGTQYYNANNQSVKKMINYDITLYAHWTTNNGINVANQTQIIEAFKWAPTNNTAITVNLSGNITGVSSTIETVGGSNVILNLNGKTLDLNKHFINVHCTFTIKDTATGGTITNGANAYGGAICAIGGTVILESGTIQNCSATANNEYGGGAVYLNNWGNFTMNGGTIKNCTAVKNGGAVRVRNGSVFTMNGGVIDGCSASYGGGVMMDTGSSVFTMNGGVIQNCTASTCGGGVSAACTFNMNGGVIWNNRVTTTASGVGKGGGVAVGGTTTMTGGYIINNTVNRNAAYGGVGVYGSCTFNMQGGIIWGNKHNGGNSDPSGVGLDNNARYNKTGGLVDPAIDLTLENPLAPIVHITMKDNIDLTSSVVMKMKQTITLDLNGKTLTQTKTTHTDVLDLGGPTTLHIQDSVGGGTITRSDAATTVCGVYLYHNDAVLYLHSGTISNMNNQYWGSGVSVANGKFYMDGGTISGCRAGQYGGGVGCKGYFEMTGGTITGCSAAQYGGGVYFPSNCTFIMTNGTITGCTAGSSGGGVDSDGIFTMTGGTIENCTSGTCGGGVYVHSTSTFTMTDSIIKNCTAKNYGGGVYVKGSTGKFYMTNSTIEGCKALYATGGGVDNDATFTMTDSIIKDCSVVGCGGALYNYNTGTFTMSGNSKIINCSATAYDATWNGRGGAICNIGTINMESGEICGCTTANETLGAGGVEQSSGTFNLQDGILWGNKNTVTGAVNSLYQTGGTLNKTGGYIDPKTVITLDPNGGTVGTETVTVYYGDTAMPKIEKLPTRAGYSFGGFFDAAEGGTQYYDAEGKDVSGISEEKIWDKLDETMTLYARWTPNNYTISYDANGGEGAPEAMTAAYDAEVTLSSTVPTKTGYTFKEWNTEKDGSGTAYAKGATVKNLASGGETVTLYAQWTVNTYTVTLNNGGGSGDASVTATFDAVLPDVTVPTWEKHMFEGYFTEADGKGVKYIDETGKGVKAWDLTADTTLYAFWKESAKIESMDLLLGGDIGMRYHVAVNDPELKDSGTMTVSIGSKKPSEKTVPYSEAPKDKSGAILFPFTVSSIQMAEPVKVEFKDGSGKVIAEDAKSVEDYYNLVKGSDTTSDDQKEMVRTLVDYGYHAQQALSKTNGWSIGKDYAESSQHGRLSSTADDLKAYKPVISGSDPNVKDIQLSLLLDNKTTLCIYVQTKNGDAPAVTVDGESASPEDNKDGWWLVKIPDIDALNLSTMHTVMVNGYTVYLSALSYASVAGKNTIDAMRALLDYYQATLTANHKKMLTSATVTKSEYDYTGQKIEPVLTVMAGNEKVDGYHVEWNGDLINAGTYTGLVTKEGYVGGVTVKVKINPVKVTAPAAETTQFTYDGEPKTVLTADDTAPYTLEGNTATKAGNYKATATLNNTAEAANYCWTDGTTAPKIIEWSIAPMTVTKPTVEMKVFTYDGKEHTVLTANENALYTVSGNTKAEAGSYTATVALNDNKNTCWDDGSTDDISIEWSIVIVKKEVEKPTAAVTSFAYDGTEKTLVIAASEYYIVDANTETNVGEYEAIVTLKNKATTCWSDGSDEPIKIKWEITKKEIAVPAWTVNELTYTGEEQTGVTVEENAAYTLTGNTGTNAASYTATLALTDPTNTCWSDEGKTTDAKTIVWSIARKTVEVPTAVTGLVYDGTEQTGVNGGDGYTLSGTTKAKNAGSYTATATLKDTKNTCWSDGTTDAKTIEWSIAKVDPQVLNGGISVTYHPNGGSAEFSGSMTVEGKFSYDPSNGTTFTPNDTQNYNTVTVEAEVTEDQTPVSMNVQLNN